MGRPEILWSWCILATVKLLTCHGNTGIPVDIFVADFGAKRMVKLSVNGSDVVQTTLMSSIRPVSIVYNDGLKRLFWIEQKPGRIRSSDVDYKNVHLVKDLPKNSRLYGLAISPISRKLFCTDWDSDEIISMDITGTNVKTILNKTQVDSPHAITVHKSKVIIIWSDKKTGYKISTSKLNGSDIKRLVNATKYVLGLALDEDNSILYWSEYTSGKISSVSLDGTNKIVLYNDDSKDLRGIALLGNTIYFLAKGDRVHRMWINGSNEEEIQSASELIYPDGLVVLANKAFDLLPQDNFGELQCLQP